MRGHEGPGGQAGGGRQPQTLVPRGALVGHRAVEQAPAVVVPAEQRLAHLARQRQIVDDRLDRLAQDAVEQRAQAEHEAVSGPRAATGGQQLADPRAHRRHRDELGRRGLTETRQQPDRRPSPHGVDSQHHERLPDRFDARRVTEGRAVDGLQDAIAEERVVPDQVLEGVDRQVGILQRAEQAQVASPALGQGLGALGRRTAEEVTLEVREALSRGGLELPDSLDLLGQQCRPPRARTSQQVAQGKHLGSRLHIDLDEIGERHEVGGTVRQHEVVESDGESAPP